ncbi:MT-A70-domain-containing protein [Favolaschia claudopus]|uniref:MT-A70-domain-containing protein n=1 Tax=Favolaschia claudopus TaxID=2862362 RepID=A0AAW0EB81_9AGAR
MASDSEPDDEGLEVEDDPEEYDQDLEDEPDVQDDATEEGDEDSLSEDSEDGSEDDGDDSSEPSGEIVLDLEPEPEPEPSVSASDLSSQPASQPTKVPSPPIVPVSRKRSRSLSPAYIRKKALISKYTENQPRTYTVEAICALPHPVPTHALAASTCMTHMLTGSDDGYIRDYDIFTAVNGKNFLTAPQRHHAGVVEGIMKAGQVRFWWENPAPKSLAKMEVASFPEEEPALSPVYSLAMHSDALWTLAGTDTGNINLFTTRHEPGRLCHVMTGHHGRPVSALAMDHDEKGFYSAGWDGEAIQWDLNTGQNVRIFTAHGAQLACVAVRPLGFNFAELPKPDLSQLSSSATLIGSNSNTMSGSQTQSQPVDSDAKSDASFDPLFDDEPEPDPNSAKASQFTSDFGKPVALPPRAIAPPKNAPPLLDTATSSGLSPDILMTASIDGQVILWDKRTSMPGTGVGRLWMSEKTPPWCLSACWSADGGQIYAGRRNGTIDVWDTRQLGVAGPGNVPRILKTLRNPPSSGVVSCVAAFPDGKHIASASVDNLRLWNAAEAGEPDVKVRGGVQFKIIPGHHGGYISQMCTRLVILQIILH